jgi:hypothetical protein
MSTRAELLQQLEQTRQENPHMDHIVLQGTIISTPKADVTIEQELERHWNNTCDDKGKILGERPRRQAIKYYLE